MHKVSIIIPAYNEEKYLPKLLNSLSFQKGISKIETIVSVSPKTKDKTRQIAESYKCKITKGGMPATARNNGAEQASYDILFFIDADSYSQDEKFLLNAITEFKSRNLDLAGTLISPDFIKETYPRKIFYNGLYNFVNFMFLFKENTYKPKQQSGMFFKKETFYHLNGFKEGIFGEDSEIIERAIKNNPPFKFGILKECGKIKNSVRRYEKNGPLKFFLKIGYLNAKAEILGYHSLKGTINNYFNKDRNNL